MKILFLGDIVGKPGREIVSRLLPSLIEQEGIHFTIANCENVAGGKGVHPRGAEELLGAGVDLLTSGNHIWQRPEIIPYMRDSDVLLRPANYPPGVPGFGYATKPSRCGVPVCVINLSGRVFMDAVDCPFQAAERLVTKLRPEAAVIVVDMHAEATSEKLAMGWFLDGRVSAVLGTHTHVQTADERVLPGGTAYMTDVGMCGPVDSVIGVRRDQVIERFLTKMRVKFEVAAGRSQVQGAIVEVDEESGRARSLRRIARGLDGG